MSYETVSENSQIKTVLRCSQSAVYRVFIYAKEMVLVPKNTREQQIQWNFELLSIRLKANDLS